MMDTRCICIRYLHLHLFTAGYRTTCFNYSKFAIKRSSGLRTWPLKRKIWLQKLLVSVIEQVTTCFFYCSIFFLLLVNRLVFNGKNVPVIFDDGNKLT
jgi:hypothetical protein